MAERSNDEIWERLGSVDAKLDGLGKAINRSDDKAEQHRDRVNERLTNLENDMGEIRPVVDDFRNLRAKAAGAILVLGGLGAVLGWLFTAFADQIKALVFRMLGIH